LLKRGGQGASRANAGNLLGFLDAFKAVPALRSLFREAAAVAAGRKIRWLPGGKSLRLRYCTALMLEGGMHCRHNPAVHSVLRQFRRSQAHALP
jgi:hypothetical protein